VLFCLFQGMEKIMNQSTELNLASPAFKANPYPTFARLRAHDPVYQLASSAGQNTWLITRYAEVEFVLHDERFTKDQRKVLPPEALVHQHSSIDDLFSTGMGKFDPPDHTRLRSLVNLFFTPRRVEQWRPRIQQITDELIDAVAAKGHMDLIAEFAFPLPLQLILEMLGVPDTDSPQLHTWARQIVDALDDPVAFQRVGEQFRAWNVYLLALIETKRQALTDDLISSLIRDESRLSVREMVAMIFLLIVAGHQTTGSLISNGMLALLTHPEQLALLRQQPTLIKTAIEEFLRYHSPLMHATDMWAREDIVLGGKLIRRGDLALVSLASANRDDQAFVEPDILDITRQENRQLAFGKGIHYCLGAPLARLEAQIAIGTLVRRLPHLRLQIDPQSLAWRPGAMILGVNYLPVAF